MMHLTFDAPLAGFLNTLLQYALGPAFVVLVGVVLDRRFKKRQSETTQQITNKHPEHLRDDLDSKFALVFAKLNYVLRVQKKQGKALIAVRNDVAQLFDGQTMDTKPHEIIELEKEISEIDELERLEDPYTQA